jgi:hypothetical protein
MQTSQPPKTYGSSQRSTAACSANSQACAARRTGGVSPTSCPTVLPAAAGMISAVGPSFVMCPRVGSTAG